jgi:hypothetical protein
MNAENGRGMCCFTEPWIEQFYQTWLAAGKAPMARRDYMFALENPTQGFS